MFLEGTMNRRDFLRIAAMTVPAAGISTHALFAQSSEASAWRTYEVTTSVRVLKPSGRTKVWLPQPLVENTSFQRVLTSNVQCDGGITTFHKDPRSNMKKVAVEFPAGKNPAVTTMHPVSTRNWSVSLTASFPKKQPVPQSVTTFLQPTRYIPTDGIVKSTADEIVKGATMDVEETHAIYEWIVANTYRNPKVRGCGVGDIRPMLETGDLGGKCADLNALFVGLVKASGIPARDAYGIRVGPSEFEARSLGVSSDVISKAQHCRAEVFLTGFGWVPMDPADLREVILEEPGGNLVLTDTKVQAVKQRLFGSWEMNWMAYNYAQDVALPGSSGPPLHFFMYPQAETDQGRRDPLDSNSFHYEITSHPLGS
jgi:transglutaminase-like putative cysteine protease